MVAVVTCSAWAGGQWKRPNVERNAPCTVQPGRITLSHSRVCSRPEEKENSYFIQFQRVRIRLFPSSARLQKPLQRQSSNVSLWLPKQPLGEDRSDQHHLVNIEAELLSKRTLTLLAPTKRKASDQQPSTKKQKQESTSTSSRHPFTVAAFGSGENAELGLGPNITEAKRPKINPYLDRTNDLCKYGNVIGLACGSLHSVAFTADNKIITWGVNDEGALGRDTEWEGGLRDVEDEDEEADLNPLESIPGEVSLRLLASETIVQVDAGDNCTFALTSAGHVYGWGTFRVRSKHLTYKINRD